MSLAATEVVSGLIEVSYLGPIAYGMSLELSASKMFDFGLAGIFGGASSLVYVLTVTLGWTGALPIIVVIAIAGLVNGLLYQFVYRRMIQRTGSTMVALIASIGVLYVLAYTGSIGLNYSTQALSVGIWQGSMRVGGVSVPVFAIAAMVGLVIIVAIVEAVIHGTRYGAALRAISDNAGLAGVLGVKENVIVTSTFVLGGALTALGAYVSSVLSEAAAFNGEQDILLVTLAIIVAGMGRQKLSILGVAAVAVVEAISVLWINSEWQITVGFTFLVLIIVLAPRGVGAIFQRERT